jgi:hypothetical protein
VSILTKIFLIGNRRIVLDKFSSYNSVHEKFHNRGGKEFAADENKLRHSEICAAITSFNHSRRDVIYIIDHFLLDSVQSFTFLKIK